MTTAGDIYERVPDFLRAIDDMMDAQDHHERMALMQRFKSEAFVLALCLNEIGLTGGAMTEGFPGEACDFCHEPIDGLYVDGATPEGWANMCPACFARHGVGLGWGIGQMYRAQGDGEGSVRWICIAGGDTLAADADGE